VNMLADPAGWSVMVDDGDLVFVDGGDLLAE
jgi:hypothetical protein